MSVNPEQQAIIQEFCTITNQDEARAIAMLNEVEFNLENAVIRYFSELDNPLPNEFTDEVLLVDNASRKRKHSATDNLSPKRAKTDFTNIPDSSTSLSNEIDDSKDFSQQPDKVKSSEPLNSLPSTSKSYTVIAANSESSTDESIPSKITVMSYNIDGSDERRIEARTKAVLEAVSRVNPEIIFFQGVTDLQNAILLSVLSPKYNIFQGHNDDFPYYTLTAIKEHIKVVKHEIVKFKTRMGRNLLVIEAKWNDLNLKLMNSHLESLWQGTADRKNQFIKAMDKVREFMTDSNAFILFGGDTNLRDPEISNVPEGVQDAWVAAGSKNEHKYTWDSKLNFNKKTKTVCRSRYDRFFVKSPYQAMDFYLEGTKCIDHSGLFPSDHFAIVCKFTDPKLI